MRSVAKKKVLAKIDEVEKRIKEIKSALGCAQADRKNLLSHKFPSAIEGHENLAATLTHDLESAQDDLALLRQIAFGHLDLHQEKKIRKRLAKSIISRERLMGVTANLRAELANIERAKQLLQ